MFANEMDDVVAFPPASVPPRSEMISDRPAERARLNPSSTTMPPVEGGFSWSVPEHPYNNEPSKVDSLTHAFDEWSALRGDCDLVEDYPSARRHIDEAKRLFCQSYLHFSRGVHKLSADLEYMRAAYGEKSDSARLREEVERLTAAFEASESALQACRVTLESTKKSLAEEMATSTRLTNELSATHRKFADAESLFEVSRSPRAFLKVKNMAMRHGAVWILKKYRADHPELPPNDYLRHMDSHIAYTEAQYQALPSPPTVVLSSSSGECSP